MDKIQLEQKANDIRKDVIKMLEQAGSGHTAGSLGVIDILTALYFGIANHDPANPDWEERDRIIVSHGHVGPALYATLAHAGYFSKDKLRTLRKLGSQLQGHPERTKLPGIETTSGPLGCGLAQAAGMALAARMDEKRIRVYCLTSDGEHNEGNHWEAVMFASKYKLSNLTVFVDNNGIQLSGYTKHIMPMDYLWDKYRSFGWNTLQVNGHNFETIRTCVNAARQVYGKPTVIIADTTAGKGVSFMQDRWEWHGKAPDENQAKQALKELGKVHDQ